MAEYFGNICTCRRCNGIVHTIRRGDTLYLLSRHYNVSINEIMRANANVNVYNLQIGDQICIPVRRPAPTPPNIIGQLLNPQQNQGQMPGRPPVIQPRDEETNLEYMETSATAETSEEATASEVSAMPEAVMVDIGDRHNENNRGCCEDSQKKVKDFLSDENMTLEEFARMLKNL